MWFLVARVVVKRYKRGTVERQKWEEDTDAPPPPYHPMNLDRRAGESDADVLPDYVTIASVPAALMGSVPLINQYLNIPFRI